ncbi:hypothetical protein MBOU_35510 [Mycobacterium bourgelatii]|uniref:Putative host cell surface-exposed lipoprotein Ltp-like HTH region domain-containing protein n=1 Tax=Mycobacterium bourgelatii TaxID=1273442 RepID=A0A7I9YS33_MYCBU|nr:hypothetical protein MBOU_35510 [Mycobacterium bourgelatii]
MAPVVVLLVAIGGVVAPGAGATNFESQPLRPAGQLPLIPLSPVSQQNAIRVAKEYLDLSGYSRSGLINQLIYEGFSLEDATYAVDNITVDWNVQAARTAKEYLDMSGYSHSGLVNQLMYEGYTPAQAEYGVTAAGL